MYEERNWFRSSDIEHEIHRHQGTKWTVEAMKDKDTI